MDSATYTAYWAATGAIILGCMFVGLCWWLEPGDLWELD